jgi:hypothetical protein
MPYDFDSPVVDGSHYDAGKEINSILRDHDNVRCAADFLSVRTTIRLPPYKVLYTNNPTALIKLTNDPILVLEPGGFQQITNLRFEGNADQGYLGPNVLIEPGGGWQRFINISTWRSDGPGILMHEPHSGHMARFQFCDGSGYRPNVPGIKLPATEGTNGGLRRIIGGSGGGALGVDIAGSNTTMMVFQDTYDFSMNDSSNYGMFIANRFAIPPHKLLEIRGHNHRFGFNTTSQKALIYQPTTYYDASNSDNGVVKMYSTLRSLMSRPDTPTLNLAEAFRLFRDFEDTDYKVRLARASQGTAP